VRTLFNGTYQSSKYILQWNIDIWVGFRVETRSYGHEAHPIDQIVSRFLINTGVVTATGNTTICILASSKKRKKKTKKKKKTRMKTTKKKTTKRMTMTKKKTTKRMTTN
jgi:hypothetical protein